MQGRVLIISNVTAGLASFRTELIEQLSKEYEVFVLASDNGRREILESAGAIVIPVSMELHGTNPVKEIRLVSFYKKKIKEIHPQIVLTYTIKPNIYAGIAAGQLGIPVLANVTGLGPAVEQAGVLQKIAIPLYRYGLKRARKVFFQNISNRDFMLKHHMVGDDQYTLIPGSGVNLQKYTLQPFPKTDTIDFVFISRVVKEKGIDQYIEAAKIIRQKYPDTRFHICGGCDEKYRGIIQQLNDEGTVIYHGRIDDIAGMHRLCVCTIHPSYYPEGMSNVLLEACACGRPIITTDRPGCREAVDNGVNGFIVKQKDTKDLVDKIEQFLSLTREQWQAMGIEARKKVEREFDRQIVIDKYLEEIRKAVKQDEL